VNQAGKESTTTSQDQRSSETASFIKALWGVRYQVKDVSRSVAFYTRQLGLKLDQQTLPAFAQVSVGNLKLILSGPGASGSRPMPDGRNQESFRNEIEVGPGG
jgi:glyoxylase I family protein